MITAWLRVDNKAVNINNKNNSVSISIHHNRFFLCVTNPNEGGKKHKPNKTKQINIDKLWCEKFVERTQLNVFTTENQQTETKHKYLPRFNKNNTNNDYDEKADSFAILANKARMWNVRVKTTAREWRILVNSTNPVHLGSYRITSHHIKSDHGA